MPLKHSFKESQLGRFPFGKKLYEILEDFQNQLDKRNNAKAIIKKDVKLNKTQLKKAFGDPKDFDSVGIVFNSEGNYIIVSDGVKYNFATLDEV